jgi:hypothetical protein
MKPTRREAGKLPDMIFDSKGAFEVFIVGVLFLG